MTTGAGSTFSLHTRSASTAVPPVVAPPVTKPPAAPPPAPGSPTLPVTGPGALTPLLGLLAVSAAVQVRRRRPVRQPREV